MTIINGTAVAEQLYDLTGSQTDEIYGFGGDDVIFMADDEGEDFVDGGDGSDFISYILFSAGSVGVTIDLLYGTAEDGFGYIDTFVSIERAQGTNFDDTLWGDDGLNHLYGAAGDDRIYGNGGDDFLYGEAGADHLEGGAGMDMASYIDSASAVTVNLLTGAASGGDATGDTFSSIERLGGSEYNDWLSGDSGTNVLRGEGGDDYLRGGLGADEPFRGCRSRPGWISLLLGGRCITYHRICLGRRRNGRHVRQHRGPRRLRIQRPLDRGRRIKWPSRRGWK